MYTSANVSGRAGGGRGEGEATDNGGPQRRRVRPPHQQPRTGGGTQTSHTPHKHSTQCNRQDGSKPQISTGGDKKAEPQRHTRPTAGCNAAPSVPDRPVPTPEAMTILRSCVMGARSLSSKAAEELALHPQRRHGTDDVVSRLGQLRVCPMGGLLHLRVRNGKAAHFVSTTWPPSPTTAMASAACTVDSR